MSTSNINGMGIYPNPFFPENPEINNANQGQADSQINPQGESSLQSLQIQNPSNLPGFYPNHTYHFPLFTTKADDLEFFKSYFDQSSGWFDMNVTLGHPLYMITNKLLEDTKFLPIDEKIKSFETAIGELIYFVSKNLDPSQIFQKIELLEIALRNHFFLTLQAVEATQITALFAQTKRLPANLAQIELALFNLATKQGTYPFQHQSSLLKEILPAFVETYTGPFKADLSLDKGLQRFENLVSIALKNLNLTQPSQCSLAVEQSIREALANKILTNLAGDYKKQFDTTGLVSGVIADLTKLETFQSGNNKFLVADFMPRILSTACALESNSSIDAAIARITEQKIQNLKQKPTLFSRIWGSSKAEETRINTLADNQIKTLEKIRQRWESYFPPMPVISAVPAIPNSQQHEPISQLVMPAAIPSVPSAPAELPAPSVEPTPAAILQPSPVPLVPVSVPAPALINRVIEVKKDSRLEMISYIELVYQNVLEMSDEEMWNALPPIAQKDVLRHVTLVPSNQGKIEEVVRRIFKGKYQTMFRNCEKRPAYLNESPDAKFREFQRKGENLLDLYYSPGRSLLAFIEEFKKLQPENHPAFLSYVTEIAQKSKLPDSRIPEKLVIENDPNWAKDNWSKPANMPFSIQALERVLHAN